MSKGRRTAGLDQLGPKRIDNRLSLLYRQPQCPTPHLRSIGIRARTSTRDRKVKVTLATEPMMPIEREQE